MELIYYNQGFESDYNTLRVVYIFPSYVKILIKIFIKVTCIDLIFFVLQIFPESLIFLKIDEKDSKVIVSLSTKPVHWYIVQGRCSFKHSSD